MGNEDAQMALAFLDLADVIIVHLDTSCKLKFVNKKGMSLLGLTRAEIMERDWIGSFVPERNQPYVRKTLIRIMGGKDPLPNYVEHWMVTGEGQERLVAWHNTLLTDESGKINGILSSGIDITNRKIAEQKLRESEERFRAVFEGAQECIMIKDASLHYTHVNPAFCTLLGMAASEIVGCRADDLFGAEIGRQITERSERVLKGESIDLEQTRIVRDVPLTFHDTISPLKDDNGNIVGLCHISRDITERKHIASDMQIQPCDYPSPAMRKTLERAGIAADSDSTVLLQGESGSGKDFLARWIHERSRRFSGPFLSINCAALPKDLAESELFGHERGAFTGAHRLKKGLLELAEGGTILLNEIGELDLSLQAKLLAFLDTRSFLRIGGQKHLYINARLIAASHRDLAREVEHKSFLAPLFYRLSVFPIHVPPLRERHQDLPILAKNLLLKLATEMQLTEIPDLNPSVIRDLTEYSWLGNVRELRNVLERSLILWRGGPFHLDVPQSRPCPKEWSYTIRHDPNRAYHDIMEDVSIALCRRALNLCGGNKKEAAKMLRMSRETLYRYLRKP